MENELTITDLATLLYFVEEEIKQRQIQITQLQDDDSFEVTVFIGSLEKGIEMFEDLRRKIKFHIEKLSTEEEREEVEDGR